MEPEKQKSWWQELRESVRTVETAVGLVIVTPGVTLDIECQGSGEAQSIHVQSTDGLRIWREAGLDFKQYGGPVRVVAGVGGGDIVVFDQLTGEPIGLHRVADTCAIGPLDVGVPGVSAVLRMQRAETYQH